MKKIHLVATVQKRNVGKTTEKSLDSLSQTLTPSAAAFKAAAIAAGYIQDDSKSKSEETETQEPQDESTDQKEDKVQDQSTFAVHADATAEDIIKGFCKFDSANADTDAYKVKRAAYDSVRSRYPSDMKNMLRDEKVMALRAINRVGFYYYAVQVEAFTEVEGVSKMIKSKTHHRLEKMSRASVEKFLKEVFNAEIRPVLTKGKQESEEGKTSDSTSEESNKSTSKQQT